MPRQGGNGESERQRLGLPAHPLIPSLVLGHIESMTCRAALRRHPTPGGRPGTNLHIIPAFTRAESAQARAQPAYRQERDVLNLVEWI